MKVVDNSFNKLPPDLQKIVRENFVIHPNDTPLEAKLKTKQSDAFKTTQKCAKKFLAEKTLPPLISKEFKMEAIPKKVEESAA